MRGLRDQRELTHKTVSPMRFQEFLSYTWGEERLDLLDFRLSDVSSLSGKKFWQECSKS